MRRGLISWSKQEVPPAALEQRVAKLQQAMLRERLDAVLAYTSTAQPAAVSWLTQFVPYSNDGLLVVLPGEAPVFFASFSKRVAGWIREVSHVGEIRLGPQLGRGAVTLLKERLAGQSGTPRLGLVGYDTFPWTVTEPFIEAGWGDSMQDAGRLFASVRHPSDEFEIRLAARAASMASAALSAIPADARHASRVLSAVEASARCSGAEEVFLQIAPDLAADARLRRMEGDADVGARFAVQLSLAYKGVWVRETRSLSIEKTPNSWTAAERWLGEALAALRPESATRGPSGAPGKLSAWSLEACLGSEPLRRVAGSDACEEDPSQTPALPHGTPCVLSVRLDLADGPWRCAKAFLLGQGAFPDA